MNFPFKQRQMDKNGISLEFVYTQCIDMNFSSASTVTSIRSRLLSVSGTLVCKSKHMMPPPSFQDSVFLIRSPSNTTLCHSWDKPRYLIPNQLPSLNNWLLLNPLRLNKHRDRGPLPHPINFSPQDDQNDGNRKTMH